MKLPLRRTLVRSACNSAEICCRIIILYILPLLFCFTVNAQTDSLFTDTSTLKNITVNAFTNRFKWIDVPASVAVLGTAEIQRFNGSASLVPVMNTVAGVRMEERSPGSYRLSLRGSLLRSPFGVRNIKIYWNEFPLTDATGNTYLNLVNSSDIQNITIIKGPSASIYGANTGGVILLASLDSLSKKQNSFKASVTGGSYGLINEQTGWMHQGDNFFSSLNQSHVQSDGYRENTKLRRDDFKWNGSYQLSSKQQVQWLAFYSNIFYQLPGALTQQQFNENSRQARPGVVEKKTAVTNKTAFAGLNLNSALGSNIQNVLAFSINHTDFKNPFTTNYETRNELNVAGRDYLSYKKHINQSALGITVGAEWLYNKTSLNNYGNINGERDTVQFKNLFHVMQYFFFAQLTAEIKNRLLIQADISRNSTRYYFKSLTDSQHLQPEKRSTGAVLMPRVSASYKLSASVSFYAAASRGFSPPTIEEVNTTSGDFNRELKPEQGWNYEAGLKGTLIQNHIDFNLSFYHFALKQAIVRRIDEFGNEYYLNAGSTTQKGAEAFVNWHLLNKATRIFSSINIWNSFSYQPYKFKNYIVNENNYSGNKLTGVPELINVCGADLKFKKSYTFYVSFNYTSSLPLNDANSAYANPYRLLQMKAAKDFVFRKITAGVFLQADNILNEHYSLGNDLNAFGGRYFNPASKINFQAGLHISF